MTLPKITEEVLINALETLCSEEDLQPYKDLGNGLYKLPNGAITNQRGFDEYLKELWNKLKEEGWVWDGKKEKNYK